MIKRTVKRKIKRRIKHQIKNGVTGIILTLIIGAVSFPQLAHFFSDHSEVVQARVIRVMDGDTIEIELNGVIERVRFIGIDAPEMGFYGGTYEAGATEATDFVRFEIERVDHVVYLQASGNDRDRFGRLRRYVWLDDPSDMNDETKRSQFLLNQRLLDYGHAVMWE